MGYLAIYHGFLKETWEDWAKTAKDSDFTRGVPAPPAEKPFPEASTLVDLTPPEELSFGRMPVAQAIKQRRSRRQYTQDPLGLDELSFLLWATQGVQKTYKRGFGLRTVPAGSARHPFETYLMVHRVTGLEPGLYRYLALEHKFCTVYLDAEMAGKASDACGNSRMVETSAVVFAWAAIPYRRVWHSLHHQHYAKDIAIEAGHVCQNLYLACEAIGAGTCAVGGYLQPKLDALLGIDGEEEFAVYVAPVGKVRTGGAAEWSGQIERVDDTDEGVALWVKSFSFWDGDVFVAEFPRDMASGYMVGDFVRIEGELTDVCSDYEGWPLLKGEAIERRADPDGGS